MYLDSIFGKTLEHKSLMLTFISVAGILFLVPITRLASIIHSLKNSQMHENGVIQVEMPWAAAVSGTGACLALITAGLLVFFTWSDERHKWKQFEEDSAIVFKNNKPRDEYQTKVEKEEDGTYDNVITMNDK